eukprot:symbB.v1.2.002538.t1/scaffold103.1/size331058/3
MFANWSPPCRVLVEHVSEWFSIFFLLYRCVLGFAVLNVVNAVFVQQTMKTASSDEDIAFKQREKDIAQYNRKVKKLFATMDSSGDGAINFEEFSKLVKSPKLRFWMSQLELEYHDLLSLFEFLDNGDGNITLHEFIDGAARLRGSAKSLDVWRMETKVEVLFEEVLTYLDELRAKDAAEAAAKDPSSPTTSPKHSSIQDIFNQSAFRHIKATTFREDGAASEEMEDKSVAPVTSKSAVHHTVTAPGFVGFLASEFLVYWKELCGDDGPDDPISALALCCAEHLKNPELAKCLDDLAARVARNGFQVVDLKAKPPCPGDALFHRVPWIQ